MEAVVSARCHPWPGGPPFNVRLTTLPLDSERAVYRERQLFQGRDFCRGSKQRVCSATRCGKLYRVLQTG
jgi:hypothetical protein